MNEEEFEELFGNTPFENIKKIRHYIDKNYIPVQIVKDKIEELKAQYKIALEENSTKAFILKCQTTILQELIKEREEK